jgi:hypothetical protein
MSTTESTPSPPNVPTRPQRRWFQFSLLTLLILVAVVAVGTKCWMGPHREVAEIFDNDKFHWILPCYGVEPNSYYELSYLNTFHGKHYQSVVLRIRQNIQTNKIILDGIPEYLKSVMRIDFMTYGHDRQLEFMQKLLTEHPQQDYLCCTIIRFDHHDYEHWIKSITDDYHYGRKVPPFETVYLSKQQKMYCMTKLLYSPPYIGLQMQEIQLADVSPELRPRVEEELNKLKAE